MVSLSTAFAAAVVGISTHLCFFVRGEHHRYGTRYIQIFTLAILVAFITDVRIAQQSFIHALFDISLLATCYLTGLYTSLLVYRAFFHPLNNFPGPLGNKLGNLWFSTQLSNADAYKQVFHLHQKHGDFVRVGSSDLSIIHPKAMNVIYGPGTKCDRAAFYDGDPLPSMISLRERAAHDKRRRVWSPAFSDKALRGYAERIKLYDDQLISRIDAISASETSMNLSKWFNYYSFDAMGDLAFGSSFDMLQNDQEHWAIGLMNTGLAYLALLPPVWLSRILISIPGLLRDHERIVEFCNEQLEKRIKQAKGNTTDIMATLLAPHKESAPTGRDLLMLQGDSRLIVIAGSDTTAATLTHIFYHLANDPSLVSRLRAEIEPQINSSGEIMPVKLQHLDHLNGIINETLRLHHPVPTQIPRLTPPEGIQIGDTFVPGGITVWCPPYALGRNEEIYTQAHDFIPERWYSRPELVKEKSAFSPFAIGPLGCIGKPLALMQIRTLVAKIVIRFDVGFADGEDGTGLLERSKDHFTLGLEDLNVVFRKRW